MRDLRHVPGIKYERGRAPDKFQELNRSIALTMSFTTSAEGWSVFSCFSESWRCFTSPQSTRGVCGRSALDVSSRCNAPTFLRDSRRSALTSFCSAIYNQENVTLSV